MTTTLCQLCTDPTNERRYEVWLCRTCQDGYVERGLSRLGCVYHTEVMAQKDKAAPFHRYSTVSLPKSRGYSADFRQETTVDRAVQWVAGKDPQAGEPLFDRFVRVADPTFAVEELLQSATVQSALFELVSLGTVSMRPMVIHVTTLGPHHIDEHQTLIPLAVLASCCVAYAR